MGPFGELWVLVHQLRLEMLLVGKDVPLPLGDCLLLADPDLLCDLRANTRGGGEGGGGGGERFAVQNFIQSYQNYKLTKNYSLKSGKKSLITITFRLLKKSIYRETSSLVFSA